MSHEPPASPASSPPASPRATSAGSSPDMRTVGQRGVLFVLGSLLGRGITYLTSLLLTRFVSPETLGAFFFSLTVLQTLILVAVLGQDTLVLRALPGLQAQGPVWVWARVRAGMRLVIVSSLAWTLGFEALWWLLGRERLSPPLWSMVAVMVGFLVFHGLHRLVSMATLAREKVLASMLVRQWLFPVLFPVLFLVLSGLLEGQGADGMLHQLQPGLAYGLAALVSALSGGLWLYARVRGMAGEGAEPSETPVRLDTGATVTAGELPPPPPTSEQLGERLTREGMPVMGAALLGHGLLWLDSMLVGLLCPLADAGRYGLVVRVSMAGMLLLDAFNSALGPAVGRVKHDPQASGRLYARAARTGFLLYLPLLVVATLEPLWLLRWFGEAYATSDAASALRFLVWGQAVNVATGGSGLMLILLGRAELAWRNSVLTFGGLLLAWTLVSLQGGGTLSLQTAALLSAGAIALVNVLRGVQLYRHFGIVPWGG